jgi:hypothetical protein
MSWNEIIQQMNAEKLKKDEKVDTITIPDHWIRYSQTCASKLPYGASVIGNVKEKDMSGIDHNAVVVVWVDKTGPNKAFFDEDTGEYLGHGCP